MRNYPNVMPQQILIIHGMDDRRMERERDHSRLTLTIEGMTCASCATRVEKAMRVALAALGDLTPVVA